MKARDNHWKGSTMAINRVKGNSPSMLAAKPGAPSPSGKLAPKAKGAQQAAKAQISAKAKAMAGAGAPNALASPEAREEKMNKLVDFYAKKLVRAAETMGKQPQAKAGASGQAPRPTHTQRVR